MLQKEEKATVVLMITALLVLMLIYYGFFTGGPSDYSDRSSIGDQVVLQGEVVGKRNTFTGDHLILTVDYDDSLIKVFVHRNNGADRVERSVNILDTISVLGIVEEYQGEREIVVTRPEDINVLENA